MRGADFMHGDSREIHTMSTDYAPIETLEVRRLLSAVLRSNGTLAITGTTGSDTIVLTTKIVQEFQPTGIIVPVEHFVITTNGTEEADVQSYRVKRIDVSLDNGNDSFTVPSRLQTKIYADGGRGNDTITGGRNHDTLDGGLGNDSLVGNAGNDVLGSANGGDTAIG